MKNILFLALTFFCLTSFAGEHPLGKKLEPVMVNNSPQFYLYYKYDINFMSWSLEFTPDLPGGYDDYLKIPETLYWTFVTRDLMVLDFEWQKISREQFTGPMNYKLDNILDTMHLLRNHKMKDLFIAIASKKTSDTRVDYFVKYAYIDLKDLCEKYPEKVFDGTSSKMEACVLDR